MINIILSLALSVTVECKEGIRDDPVLIIRDTKNHYIYFLPREMKTCKNYGYLFLFKSVSRVCGCKILKDSDQKDRLRLRCAARVNGVVMSSTVSVYYYYPELTSACIKTRDHLMFKAK